MEASQLSAVSLGTQWGPSGRGPVHARVAQPPFVLATLIPWKGSESPDV